MKKFYKILRGLLLIGMFMSLIACGQISDTSILSRVESSKKPVITWGVKVDTNLFGYYNIENQAIEGFDIDMAKEITNRLTDGKGIPKFVEVTSKTRIPLLKNGNIDAIIATMTITEERKKVVNFSDVYFEAGQSLLVADDSDIQGVDTLTPDHTVIVIKGSSSARNIREAAPQANIIELENYSEAFVALQSGQGDALTTDNAILMGMIAQNPNFRLAGDIFTDEPYGIAMNKGQEDLQARVNQILDQMRKDGAYDAIYQKWFAGLE